MENNTNGEIHGKKRKKNQGLQLQGIKLKVPKNQGSGGKLKSNLFFI